MLARATILIVVTVLLATAAGARERDILPIIDRPAPPYASIIDFQSPLQGPVYLPGDTPAPGAAAGNQQSASVAAGNGGFLVVWTDMRTSNPEFNGFGDGQSGDDIYAARLDPSGNVLDATPIIVSQAAGSQEEPAAAWNGQHWLVVWQSQIPSSNGGAAPRKIFGARIADDGTLVDTTPFEIYEAPGFAGNLWLAIVANGTDWLVVGQADSGGGIGGVRVAGDATILDPTPVTLTPGLWFLYFSITLHVAQGEYLLVYDGQGYEARRFAADLTPVGGPIALPGPEARVASNGTEYFVTWDPSGPTLYGSRMTLTGTLLDPAGIALMESAWSATTQTDVAWDGSNWWIAHALPYPGGGLHIARVTPDGTLLDSPPLPVFTPDDEQFVGLWALIGGDGGGLQFVWADQDCNCEDEWNTSITPWDINGKHVSETAQPGPEVAISRSAPSQTMSNLAGSDGQFLSVYVSELDDERRIMAQRLDPLGQAIDVQPIAIAAGTYVTNPAAAWNGSLYMIVWDEFFYCVGGDPKPCGYFIHAVRMLPDGTVLDTQPIVVMPGNHGDVAALGDRFLIVARHFTQNTGHWVIPFAMRVDGNTGALLDAAPLELGWVFAVQPRVTTFMDKWLVVWEQRASHDENWGGTRYNFVTADGAVSFPRFAEGYGCGGATPDVAASGAVALVVCREGAPGHFLNAINGTLILPDETTGISFTISDAVEEQRGPAVAFDGTDFIVAWEDKRNSTAYFDLRTDLYGARVKETGVVRDPDGFPVQASVLPEQQPVLATTGANTLMTASVFRDDPGLKSYRVGTYHMPARPLSPPDVSFSGSPLAGCAPLAVDYTDESLGGPTSWLWSFGDGGFASDQHPTHVYQDAGTYSVYLTAHRGQGADSHAEFEYVTVAEATQAAFTSNVTNGCGPLNVSFTDWSAGGPTSWQWDFGDGAGSTLPNPAHIYNLPGSYTVTLTADGPCGPNMLTSVDHIVVPELCPTELIALEEMSIASNPVGTYLDTHPDSNSAQSLFEVNVGTAQNPSWILEHRWRFDVGTSTEDLDVAVFMYNASPPDDDHVFEYSTDNVNFTPIVTVTAAGWTSAQAPVPATLQGSIWVRVRDSSANPNGLISIGTLVFERGLTTIRAADEAAVLSRTVR